jgi:protein-tyrosine phosphatase
VNAIRDWLCIGKYSETANLDLLHRRRVGAMLQLAEAVEQPDILSFYLEVEDGLPLARVHLRAGVGFILAQRQAGRTVLVACGAGVSRSPAFATAALKEAEALSLADAHQTIRRLHPPTLIHPKIWYSLCNYYQEEAPFTYA